MALAGSEAEAEIGGSQSKSFPNHEGSGDLDGCVHKVVIFAFVFPPWAAAGTFRTVRFVRYLSADGWKPFVVTARTKTFPHIPVDIALNDWIPSTAVVVRTTVLRPFNRLAAGMRRLLRRNRGTSTAMAEASVPQSPSRLRTLKSWLRSALRPLSDLGSVPDQYIGWTLPALAAAGKVVRAHQPHLLYSSGPPHSSHIAALFAKWCTGLPLVLDFRDPWAHCDWDSGSSRLVNALQRRLEKLCVRGADKVILNTESLCRQFRENYPAKWSHKFVTITNGYDPELRTRIESLIADMPANGAPSSAGEFCMCHAGAVYGERRLEPLVAAIAMLNGRGHRIKLEQIGRIADKEALEHAIAEHQAESYIKLTTHRPHDEVMRRMAAADAHVLLQPGTAIQVPGKLFEMMMFEKPIFALAGAGETSNIIRKYDLGICVDSADPTAIASELERLVANPRRNPSASAAALRDFDGRHLTHRLARVFDGLVNTPSSSERA